MCRLFASRRLGWRAPDPLRVGLVLSVGLVLLGTGCRVVRSTTEIPGQALRAVTPGKKEKDPVDPVEMQQKLLRFATDFATDATSAVDNLRRGTNAIGQAEVLKWKILLASQASSIV